MSRATLAALILMFASLSSVAADNGFYLGAAVGQGNVDSENIDFGLFLDQVDGDDTAFKVIAGFRPLDLFAVEVNYVDLGTAEDDNVRVDTTGVDAFALLFLPIPLVDIFFKAGAITWDQDFSAGQALAFPTSTQTTTVNTDGTDFAYGAGVGLGFGSLAARLEYERFEIENTDTVDMISLGLTWTFL